MKLNYYQFMEIPELERLARLGDTEAQDEVQDRAMHFATNSMRVRTKESVSNDEFMKEIR